MTIHRNANPALDVGLMLDDSDSMQGAAHARWELDKLVVTRTIGLDGEMSWTVTQTLSIKDGKLVLANSSTAVGSSPFRRTYSKG